MESDLLQKAHRFEETVGKIFSLTYRLERSDRRFDVGGDYLTANGVVLDVKYHPKNDILHFLRLLNAPRSRRYRGDKRIFVTNTLRYADGRDRLADLKERDFPEPLRLVTLENLLFLCGEIEPLKAELLSCLDFSTESLLPTPLEPSVRSLLEGAARYSPEEEPIRHSAEGEPPARIRFAEELLRIRPGKRSFRTYENFCSRLISTVFQNNLDAPRSQFRNNKDLFRFDLIAALKSEPESFWKFIYEKFNSCFVLFECKNYAEPIGQEQIYLTEKYLFDKALRNVAILFTRKGGDAHAHLAAQDILKEHGKLILILDDGDVKNLEACFYDEALSPSEYLMEKTKEFLLKIDK